MELVKCCGAQARIGWPQVNHSTIQFLFPLNQFHYPLNSHNISVNSGRVTITLTATTDLGESILSESLKDGELAQWEYGKRFRVPINVRDILLER